VQRMEYLAGGRIVQRELAKRGACQEKPAIRRQRHPLDTRGRRLRNSGEWLPISRLPLEDEFRRSVAASPRDQALAVGAESQQRDRSLVVPLWRAESGHCSRRQRIARAG